MPRATWSGSITFGLVSVPVKLHPAIHKNDIRFHLLSREGGYRLRNKLYCPETGEEFQVAQAARGFEISPGEHVMIEEEELAQLRPRGSRTIEIIDFVDLDQIDPIHFNRPYYVAPDDEEGQGYRLLLQALADTGKVGIARFIMQGREHLAAIRPLDGVLCLELMHFSDEVVDAREVPGLPVEGAVPLRELEMERRLIGALASDFEPQRYRAEHRERVLELIERKAAGRPVTGPADAEPPPHDMSLARALEESLHRVQRPARRRRTA